MEIDMVSAVGPNKADWQNEKILQPAFSTRTQALCFLALVVLLLALPEIITRSNLITRRHSYEIMPENQGAYSFVMNEVFDSNEEIDILFLGSSILFAAVDTPAVQKELSDDLGRPAKVVTFGHYFNSVDVLYMQMRDLLQRKRPRLVALSIPTTGNYTDGPSTTAFRFLRYSDDKQLFADLPLKYEASLYACGVLRVPRDLLTIIRKNKTTTSPFAANLGADKAEVGMGRIPEAFETFVPPAPSLSKIDLLHPGDSDESGFRFTNEEVPLYQNLYLMELFRILKENEVPVMVLNIPGYDERHDTMIVERKNWAKALSMDIPLVGISPAVLFAGLSDEEIEKLYFDNEHFNANGNEFFTRAVLPGVLEVYKTHAAKTR